MICTWQIIRSTYIYSCSLVLWKPKTKKNKRKEDRLLRNVYKKELVLVDFGRDIISPIKIYQFFVFLLPSCLSIKGFYICWLKSKTSYTNNVHVNAPKENKNVNIKKQKIKSHRLCKTSIFDNKVVENLKYSQQSICITISPRSNCYDIIHSKGVLNFVLNWTEIKELRKYVHFERV